MKYSCSRSVKHFRIRPLISVLALIFMIALFIKGSERAGLKVMEGEKQAVYGEYLEWKEVNDIFPKYSNAVVADLDTGMRFGVQRRAGTLHADVQPLTAGDTGVMKKIYGEEWSWKRRAVLVETGGRRIAGSMNGMPHGGGSIRGNNFQGHFCIHFRGSRVHASGREDPAHRMMVFKAAGMLDEMMAGSTPGETAGIFFTALDQKELDISVRAAHFHRPADLPDLFIKASEINRISLYGVSTAGSGVVDVSLGVLFKNGRQNSSRGNRINLVSRGSAGWKVDYETVRDLLVWNPAPGAENKKVFDLEDPEVD